jgi:hypothetical protein
MFSVLIIGIGTVNWTSVLIDVAAVATIIAAVLMIVAMVYSIKTTRINKDLLDHELKKHELETTPELRLFVIHFPNVSHEDISSAILVCATNTGYVPVQCVSAGVTVKEHYDQLFSIPDIDNQRFPVASPKEMLRIDFACRKVAGCLYEFYQGMVDLEAFVMDIEGNVFVSDNFIHFEVDRWFDPQSAPSTKVEFLDVTMFPNERAAVISNAGHLIRNRRAR